MKKRLWLVLWTVSARGLQEKSFGRHFLTEAAARRFYQNFVLKRQNLVNSSIHNTLEVDVAKIVSTVMSFVEDLPGFKKLWSKLSADKRTKISHDQAKFVRNVLERY